MTNSGFYLISIFIIILHRITNLFVIIIYLFIKVYIYILYNHICLIMYNVTKYMLNVNALLIKLIHIH